MARLRWLQNARTGDAGTEILKPIRMGTSYATALTTATAGVKWLSLYTNSSATSGDCRGIYNRLYITGAGGGGESLRSFTDVYGVAAANANGGHITLQMGNADNAGSVTGLGNAIRGTLTLPNVAMAAFGTYSGIMSEIYSAGASSDAGAVTLLSFIKVVNSGDTTGMATVDDDAVAMSFTGCTSGSGNMIYTHAVTTAGSPTGSIKIHIDGVGDKYLYYWDTEGTSG